MRVGDIVHLSNNETIPADILLLRTSNPHGVCYIDTCDLDGETNLKLREVVRGFVDKQQLFKPIKFTSRVEVDLPTTKIFKFNGALIHPSGERVPISTENLLLRESRLKVSKSKLDLIFTNHLLIRNEFRIGNVRCFFSFLILINFSSSL